MTDIKKLKEKLIKHSYKYKELGYIEDSYEQKLSLYVKGFNDAISLLEECLEALDFYGDKNNYFYTAKIVSGGNDYFGIKEPIEFIDESTKCYGGVTARQAIKNLEKKISEEK